jgi:diguanylate cyclase (GGDEF)-like protein
MLALITRAFCLDINLSSAFWPANGALVVAMLVLPRRFCLLVLASCFTINIGLNLLARYSPFDSFLFSVLNIVGSYFVALQTRWFCGATTDLARFQRLIRFGGIAFSSAALEAAIGELFAPANATASNILKDWLQWSLCDGFGFLLATPAILFSLKNVHNKIAYGTGRLECWLLLCVTALVTTASFLFAHSPLFLLIYPLLILTAFRAGPSWVLASILNTALISSGFTAHGYGPLAALSSSNILLQQGMIQPFLISIFLAAVPANNALGETARASRRLVRMKDIVEHTANHDGLTTLVNRTLFRRRLDERLRGRLPCAVLFVDLDRFKHVNDTMGHSAGDQLLRAFGARIVEAAGPEATVARFGGDEFAVLLPCNAPAVDPEILCCRIIEVARLPFLLASGPAHVSASIGLALSTGLLVDPSEMMRQADIALYAVKSAGRNGYQIFNETLGRLASDRAEIEADLISALEQGGQLELHYQMKVDRDNVVQGVEALLRWQHPIRGFVPPNLVISVAEESGLIIPLGDWILHEALRFAARWPQLNVSVNVSPIQLSNPRFLADTLKAYSSSELPYGHLELEITETALMGDINVVNGTLSCLRSAGIRIALDDFGTGYSSLRHLHRCAVDRVKIDQSFVSGLDGSIEAAAIVKAVVQLGHAMGLQVTAEGVETEAQRRFLLETDVDELQGYLFSKPVNETVFEAMMNKPRNHTPNARPMGYAVIRGGLG